MVMSFDLTCLAEKLLKSRIAKTLCVLAIVKSAACSTKGKLLYGFLGSCINVGFLFPCVCQLLLCLWTDHPHMSSLVLFLLPQVGL